MGTSATFFFGIACVMTVVGWIVCERLLLAMSTPQAAMPYAVAYMRMIFLAMPVLYTFAFLMSVLRGAGDAKTPFYYLLMSVVLDIALNPKLAAKVPAAASAAIEEARAAIRAGTLEVPFVPQ